MVASTAFSARPGWSVCAGIRWSISRGIGGQFGPESGGQYQRILQLMARTVREDAEIEIVTYGDKGNKEVINMVSRYKVFFGNRKYSSVFYDGTEEYIRKKIVPIIAK